MSQLPRSKLSQPIWAISAFNCSWAMKIGNCKLMNLRFLGSREARPGIHGSSRTHLQKTNTEENFFQCCSLSTCWCTLATALRRSDKAQDGNAVARKVVHAREDGPSIGWTVQIWHGPPLKHVKLTESLIIPVFGICSKGKQWKWWCWHQVKYR